MRMTLYPDGLDENDAFHFGTFNAACGKFTTGTEEVPFIRWALIHNGKHMKIFRWLFGACIAAFALPAIGALCTIDSVERGNSGLRIIFNEKANGDLHIVPNPGIPYDYRVLKGQVLNQEMQPIDLILIDGTSI